ncbi:MAG TPA: ABC transporter substrate-binding protein, partial [Blastocatellia bacterium]|nr:ABC transporter substrate-binding protein [Blastocatellia bacterium]
MQQKIYQGIDELKRYEKKADFTVYDLGPGFDIIYAAFNQDPGKDKNGKPFVDPVKLKWFTNVKFRQAIDYAIDRDALVRTVLNGRGVPVYGFDSPANKTWFTDTVSKYPYDPAKARALLKEIGIYDRKGDGTAEDADGHPIKFGLMTNSSNDLKVNTITLIKDNLRKIGIDVELQPIDFNLMQSKLQFTRDFDAVVGTWQSGLPADPIMGKDILLPSGQYYVAHPRQKEPATEWEKRMSDLIQLSSRSNDLAARQKSYWEAMRIWSESLPEIDLAAQDAFVAVTNSIGNSKPSPLENFTYWNIDELYFKY